MTCAREPPMVERLDDRTTGPACQWRRLDAPRDAGFYKRMPAIVIGTPNEIVTQDQIPANLELRRA